MGQGQTSSDWHVAGRATATVPGSPGLPRAPKGSSHGLAALGYRLSEGVQLAIQGVVSIPASLAPPPNADGMATCPLLTLTLAVWPSEASASFCLLLAAASRHRDQAHTHTHIAATSGRTHKLKLNMHACSRPVAAHCHSRFALRTTSSPSPSPSLNAGCLRLTVYIHTTMRPTD